MSARKIKVGIIGGSGLDDPDILSQRRETVLETQFGAPSDCLIEGRIGGVDCVLLARHGRKHDVMPGNVNYRANVWALKTLGCTHVLASTATGSLRKDIKPGDIVIPDTFIDRTSGRKQTFYDGQEGHPPGVCHLPMEPAFCERMRALVLNAAREMALQNVHDRGTVVTIEGPRFGSRAESLMHRQWGGDIVNMTTVPEVVLAKEAGLLYAAVAMATDYDCLCAPSERVNAQKVLETFRKNVSIVTELLKAAVRKIAEEDWSETIDDLQEVIKENLMLPPS